MPGSSSRRLIRMFAGIALFASVMAFGSESQGNVSQPSRAGAGPAEPAAAGPQRKTVIRLQGAAIGEGVTLNWDPVAGPMPAGYDIYRSTDHRASGDKINGAAITQTSFTDPYLNPSLIYWYTVVAVDATGSRLGESRQMRFRPDDLSPTAPTGVTGEVGIGRVTLSWHLNPQADLVGYNVYRSTVAGERGVKLTAGTLQTTTYTDPSVTEHVSYWYTITALDATGHESPASVPLQIAPNWQPVAPTGLVAAPGDALVSLAWSSNGEPDLGGYNVYRSTVQGERGVRLNTEPVTNPEYIDHTVTELVTYFYTVTAVDAAGHESAPATAVSARPDWSPSAPGNPEALPGHARVTLSWPTNPESDVTGYHVYRSTVQGEPGTRLNATPLASPAYEDTAVAELVTYFYTVTAVDAAGHESVRSAQASATPDWAPAAPTGLGAAPGVAQVALTWNANSEADLHGYNVYRSTVPGERGIRLNTEPVSSPDYTDQTVIELVTYSYTVTAIDGAGHESEAATAASVSPDWAPAAPGNPEALPGHARVTLSWPTNPESDVTGYHVYRSTVQGEPGTRLNATPLASPAYEDTAVAELVTYFYTVTAVDAAGHESERSAQTSATPDWAPGAPGMPQAALGNGSVLLWWPESPETDFAGYYIYRASAQGEPGARLNDALLSSPSYEDRTVREGTAYWYTVTAVDLRGQESARSGAASVTPNWPPAPPVGLQGTAGSDRIDLGWAPNTEADLAGYHVYRSTIAGERGVRVNSALLTALQYADMTATGESPYWYTVTAVDHAGNESAVSQQVRLSPLLPPRQVTGRVGVDRNILHWETSLTPAVAYNIYRSADGGASYARLNSAPLAAQSYEDTGADPGKPFTYVVRSVNGQGVESRPSNAAVLPHPNNLAAVTPGRTAGPGGSLPLTISSYNAAAWSGMEWREHGTSTWLLQPGEGSVAPNTAFAVAWRVPTAPGVYEVRVRLIDQYGREDRTGPLRLTLPKRPAFSRGWVAGPGDSHLAWTGEGERFDIERSPVRQPASDAFIELLAAGIISRELMLPFNGAANPGFELQDGTGAPLGWTCTAPAGSCVPDPNARHSGARSLRIDRSDGAPAAAIQQTIFEGRVLSNRPLSVRVHAKLASATPGFRAVARLRFLDRGGAELSTAEQQMDQAGDWQAITLSQRAPLGTYRVVLVLEAPSGSGSAWFDGVQVSAGSAIAPFSQGLPSVRSYYRVRAYAGPLYHESDWTELTLIPFPQSLGRWGWSR